MMEHILWECYHLQLSFRGILTKKRAECIFLACIRNAEQIIPELISDITNDYYKLCVTSQAER